MQKFQTKGIEGKPEILISVSCSIQINTPSIGRNAGQFKTPSTTFQKDSEMQHGLKKRQILKNYIYSHESFKDR